MNEPRSIHAAEDWGVVLQSVPSKNKREIVKRLVEIFELDKRDAEQILSNMPLILVDNLSFGLAMRIKKFFQKIGAVAETTNHDMIKKNCFQVLWPQTPDLSFFMKDETGPAEAPVQEKESPAKSAEISPAEKKTASYEMKPEMPKIHEAPLPAKPVPESPASVSHPPAVSEEKPAAVVPPGVDSDWERRTRELNEKLQKIHEEKQELHVQHAEATEKVKNEFQQRIEEEKKKSGEIAKAYEDLQKEAQKHEALTREGEEWRSRAVALGEKVRELETDLMQKTSALEHMTQQKDDVTRDSEKAAVETQSEISTLRLREQEFIRRVEEVEEWRSKAVALEEKVRELETNLTQQKSSVELMIQWRSRSVALGEKVRELEANLTEKTATLELMIQEKDALAAQAGKAAEFATQLAEIEMIAAKKQDEEAALQNRVSELETSLSETVRQLEGAQDREQEFSRKIAGLERNAQEHTSMTQEMEEWRSKAVALDEKVRVLGMNLMQKTSEVELMIQEKNVLAAQAGKAARNVQEMTDSLRSRDGALAQFEKQILELAEKARGYELLRQEHAKLAQERATIREEYDVKLAEQEMRLAKAEEDHRRYRSRMDRKNAAATRELGESVRGVDAVRQGLQKLIVFLGSESAVLDTEKKPPFKFPFTRGEGTPNPGKS